MGGGSRWRGTTSGCIAMLAICCITSPPSVARAESPAAEAPAAKPPLQITAPEQPAPATPESTVADPGETAGPADDSSNVTTAYTLFWQGHEQYDRGNFAAAATLFEQSYAASPEPGTLFNVALAMARAQRCSDAALTFQRFSMLPMAAALLEQATTAFHGVHATCTEVPVEHEADPATPQLATPSKHPPPRRPQSETVPPPTQQTKVPPHTHGQSAEPRQNYWNRQRILGWSFAASAALATGAAIYCNHRQRSALEEANRIASDKPPGGADQMRELKTERDRFLVGTGVALAAAGGFAIAATKLLVFDSSSDGSADVAIVVSPALRLGVSGTF